MLIKRISGQKDGGIDALKGIAIILVVIGHVIQSGDPTFDENYLFRWIYSFHMPFFMFLSGWVWNFAPFGDYVQKRFVSLVLPFFAWGFLAHVPFLALVKFPEQGLWFLWLLFGIQLLYWLAHRVHRYAPLLVAIVGLPIHLPLGYGFFFTYFAYFTLGVWLSRRGVPDLKQWRPLLLGSHIVLALLLWHRTVPVEALIQIHLPHLMTTLIRYGIAVVGTLALLQYHTVQWSLLRYLGTISGNIYAIHLWLLGFFTISSIPVGFVLLLCATVLISVVLQRVPIVRYVLPKSRGSLPFKKVVAPIRAPGLISEAK